jgi:endonuclease/exonuclease/phosphatase family metal-dependent hydrolase
MRMFTASSTVPLEPNRELIVRIATYNLENLFRRPAAMAIDGDIGQQAIDDHALASRITAKPVYGDADREALLALDATYHFSAPITPKNALLTLNTVRGQLFGRRNGSVVVIPEGRAEWTGWFELPRRDVGWQAVLNTGKVIEAVRPDVLLCVEVEDRLALHRFNEQVLGALYDLRYPHAMLIDGNDVRGIDVGILSRYPIVGIRSHIDDVDGDKRIFSRDCPVYVLRLPSGSQLVVCPNHFKSKRGGNDGAAQAQRLRQGSRAAQISREAEADISPLVLVGGDLNDTPDSPAVQPLLAGGWQDVQSHPDYPTDRPGTFGTGLAGNKIDYLIMSPALKTRLVRTGIERRGSYHPNLWEAFHGVEKHTEASDHHCVWADFDLAEGN